MMQTILSSNHPILIIFWGCSIVIHPLYWILFGRSKYFLKVHDYFFSSRTRSMLLSEIIGLSGSFIELLMNPNNLFTIAFITIFSNIILVIVVYSFVGWALSYF